MATSINLAPGTQYIVASQKRRQRLYFLSAVIAILAIVVWAALGIYKWQAGNKLAEASTNLQTVEGEISKLDTDAKRIVLFEQRLKNLDQLLDGHISWNPLLAEIERLLPPTTVVTALSVDSSQSTMTLSGFTPDVDQVAQTLASLTNASDHKTLFSGASINTITRQEQKNPDGTAGPVRYQFGAELTFDPSVLQINKLPELTK